MNKLKREEFEILYYLLKHNYTNQRMISKKFLYSLGKTNRIILFLYKNGFVNGNYCVTKRGLHALKPYKVDNAIIMAAGMSSRFAPLSYERPKGLLKVKGEILIERQIKQLKEIGINRITIVVGYMKEKFFYLKDKYDVSIVINEDYYKFNNPSSLIRVLSELKNTYICSSDNYFVDNVFEDYVYDSYYSAVYQKGKSNEWGIITNRNDRIIGIDHNPNNMLIMQGHVYFSNEFSKSFKKILKEDYKYEITRNNLWEFILEKNIKELQIYVRKYDANKVLEFDSLDDLRKFDSKYIENSNSTIFKNICKVLKCEEKDIYDISVISQGLTNMSFVFKFKNVRYVYRHPGVGTENYISRKSEEFSMKVTKELLLDKTFIYMDGKEGWKISKYIENAKILNYHNKKDVKAAILLIKKLHNSKIKSKYNFDIWGRTCNLINKVNNYSKEIVDFNDLYKKMSKLYKYVKKDNIPWVLCHCDCYNPNFLIDKNHNINLIDWEYSGNDDPANDLGTFICCSDYSYDEALEVIKMYYGKNFKLKDLRHCLAYVSISSYYWYIWAIYQESIGKNVGDYLLLWYSNAKLYLNKSLNLYEGGDISE